MHWVAWHHLYVSPILLGLEIHMQSTFFFFFYVLEYPWPHYSTRITQGVGVKFETLGSKSKAQTNWATALTTNVVHLIKSQMFKIHVFSFVLMLVRSYFRNTWTYLAMVLLICVLLFVWFAACFVSFMLALVWWLCWSFLFRTKINKFISIIIDSKYPKIRTQNIYF